jgi:hypothetical protein
MGRFHLDIVLRAAVAVCAVAGAIAAPADERTPYQERELKKWEQYFRGSEGFWDNRERMPDEAAPPIRRSSPPITDQESTNDAPRVRQEFDRRSLMQNGRRTWSDIDPFEEDLSSGDDGSNPGWGRGDRSLRRSLPPDAPPEAQRDSSYRGSLGDGRTTRRSLESQPGYRSWGDDEYDRYLPNKTWPPQFRVERRAQIGHDFYDHYDWRGGSQRLRYPAYSYYPEYYYRPDPWVAQPAPFGNWRYEGPSSP